MGGSKEGFFPGGVPVGYVLQAGKSGSLWTVWVQRNAGLILASVVEKAFYFGKREEAFLWWTPKIVWSLFFTFTGNRRAQRRTQL